MDTKSQRQKGRDSALSSLDLAIELLNLAREVSSITPVKAVFGTVSALLAMIRDSMANERDYVELGLYCADVCKALDRGMNGRRLDELSQSVRDAMGQLTTTVAGIRRNVIKRSRRNKASQILRAKNDKDAIVAWKLDLNRILHVFNTELAINTHMIVSDVRYDVTNTHTMVSDIHRNMMESRETDDQHWSTQVSTSGESPPPPPRVHFGRGELVERIIGLAENLTPIALVGTGGIGKTSIALTVLHRDRIKKRFGDNRWFIRCDQFPASCAHFLHRLSTAIGAGVKHPEDLTPLRAFISSEEMFIILDNVESILDPRGTNAREIYSAVEELGRFSNICLCLTSRISTIPPVYETLDIPTLSAKAAQDTFYSIYKHGERSGLINKILEQLEFHPLSITLLATVAHHSKWSTGRLAREWGRRRIDILHTQHDESLAATIELSLASPMFRQLGPDARDLLGIIAFFPQGVNENNVDWLFPTISNGTDILDNFCILSLTYRSNGFITMLAPLRDYFSPKSPKSSQLLCAAKDHYFSRLSVEVDPGNRGSEEMRWIRSEDVNVEHLLDVFTTIDANSNDVWNACARFIEHIYWHKRRPVIFESKIKGLPDNHPFKPQCLVELSRLFYSSGNNARARSFLLHALKLFRERGDDLQVARTLRILSEANRMLGFYEEGIEQVEEALEIYEQLNDILGQARSWQCLARLLRGDDQVDAAEEAALRAINLSEEGDQFVVYESHHFLGEVHRSKGEAEEAIKHFEIALGIASLFNWRYEEFWNHFVLAKLFFDEDRFEDAQAHIECCRLHAVDDPYLPGHTMELESEFWYRQRRFEEAESEISRAAEVFEKLGADQDLKRCKRFLQEIQEEMSNLAFQPQIRRRQSETRNMASVLLVIASRESLTPSPVASLSDDTTPTPPSS